jgi:hypothetical protein
MRNFDETPGADIGTRPANRTVPIPAYAFLMAQRVVILLEDDFDGSKASETILFALDGSEYAIDLNDAHASELREAFSRFTKAARKTGGRPGRPVPVPPLPARSGCGRPAKVCRSTPAAASRPTSWKSTKPHTKGSAIPD